MAVRTEQSSVADRSRSATAGRLLAVVAVCGAVRLWYLGGPAVQFNADEATTGLMVREILRGRHFTFYAGQDYGGTLEQYLQAVSYLLVPMPSTAWTLRLTLVALSMATCALVHLLAERVLGGGTRAALAALLFAVSPWFNVISSVTSLGFYVSGQTLCAAVLYGALRAGDGRTRGWLFGTGLCAGLAVWTSLTALFVLVPAALWLLPLLGRDARRWVAPVAGFGLGALPLLAWLAQHRRLPVPPTPAEPSTVPQRLGNLVEPVFREYVGVAYARGEGGLWLPLQIVVVVLLLAAYAVAVRRRSGLRDFLLLRVARRRPGDLLLAVPPAVAVLYAASDSTWYTGTPRYLLVTYPLLAVGLAALVPAGGRRVGRLAAVTLVLLSTVLSLGFFRDLAASEPGTRNRDAVLRQLTDRLVAEQETRVYAGYWTAMPLQFVAGDRLVVAVCGGVARFPEAQAAVAAAPAPVYVGSDHDGTDERIRAALTDRGITFRRTHIGFLTVYDRLSVPAGPTDLGL